MYFRVFVLNRCGVSKSQRLTYTQILYGYPPFPLGGLNVTIHLSRPLFLVFSLFSLDSDPVQNILSLRGGSVDIKWNDPEQC